MAKIGNKFEIAINKLAVRDSHKLEQYAIELHSRKFGLLEIAINLRKSYSGWPKIGTI